MRDSELVYWGLDCCVVGFSGRSANPVVSDHLAVVHGGTALPPSGYILNLWSNIL